MQSPVYEMISVAALAEDSKTVLSDFYQEVQCKMQRASLVRVVGLIETSGTTQYRESISRHQQDSVREKIGSL